MIAGAAFRFGISVISSISEVGIDLAEEGASITFGEDGLLSMDADGIELEDSSISESSVSIGDETSATYTKLGEGTIQSGQFSMTLSFLSCAII
jgi:hypothetical protein